MSEKRFSKWVKENAVLLAAGLIFVTLIAATMSIITRQLLEVPQPQQTFLFAQSVLALTILVSIGTFFLRGGRAPKAYRRRRDTIKAADIGFAALFGLLFLAILALYLWINGVSISSFASGPVSRLAAWFALLLIAGALVFFLLNFRDHFVDSAKRTAISELEVRRLTARAEALNSQITKLQAAGGRQIETIAVKSIGRVDYVPVSEVRWISSAKNYVELHCDNRVLLHRVSLQSLLERLEPMGMIRVHRSAAVNCRHIAKFIRLEGEKASVELNDGSLIAVGPSYRGEVLERLETLVSSSNPDFGPAKSSILSHS